MATEGCTKNPAGPAASPYVGSWYLEDVNLLETPNIIALEFRKDGTVTITPRSTEHEPYNRDLTDAFPATYKITDDGKLVLTGTNSESDTINAQLNNDELTFTGTIAGNRGPINWFEKYHRSASGETIAQGLEKARQANMALSKTIADSIQSLLGKPGLVLIPTQTGAGSGGRVRGVALEIKPVGQNYDKFEGKAWCDENHLPHMNKITHESQGNPTQIYISFGDQVDANDQTTLDINPNCLIKPNTTIRIDTSRTATGFQIIGDDWELKSDPDLYKQLVQDVTLPSSSSTTQ
jgi:hypothetical protein